MTDVAISVALMLHHGQLLQGHAIERNVAIVADDPDAAWAQLLASGECNLRANGDNLQRVRELYAGWVMNGSTKVAPMIMDVPA